MDFISLKRNYKKDPDYSQRTFDLQMLRKVLDGEQYDCLKYAFYQNYNNLGSSREPIRLDERRPCVRYQISKIVVDDSVSLLFGEGRFPAIECQGERDEQGNEELTNLVQEFIEETNLNLTMIELATTGSIGSAALLFKLIEGKAYYECLGTEYLLPKFDPRNPKDLIEVNELYKIYGYDLKLEGYENLVDDEIYWFKRTWNKEQEIYYVPWKVSQTDKKPEDAEVDKDRTVTHDLGFVPIVWIKNLPGGKNKIDGQCTFESAIDTNIELDYQLSQCGRGLKYSSEPTLMIRNAALNMQGEIMLGNGNVLEVDEKGDSKYLEISGEAAKAVMDYAKFLREVALENIHGNRSNPDKMHAAQSGAAMKLLYMSLIWLADKLRVTYGENGLKNIILMLFKANEKFDLMINNKRIAKNTFNSRIKVILKWGDWFPSTPQDRVNESNSLRTLKDSGLMSRKTAVGSIQQEYDIIDLDVEIDTIVKEIQETQELLQPKVTENISA